MALSIGGNKSSYKGIFISKAKVTAVEDLSHQAISFLGGQQFDLAVKLTFDIGKSFSKEITVFGNFKRDADNAVSSIGAAFKVGKIFENLGITGDLTPSNELPPEWLTAIIGKECYCLDYAIGVKDDGKNKYAAWDRIDTDKDFLLNDFLAEVKKGYPKKYVLWLEGNDPQGDAFEGAVAAEAQPVSSNGSAVDNDLPW